MRLVLVSCCFWLLIFPACGGDEKDPPYQPGSGGSSGRGGSSGISGKGGTTAEAGAAGEGVAGEGAGGEAGGNGSGGDAGGGPNVRIISPVETNDPNGTDVIIVDEVTVTCEVTGSFDESTVRIEMLHEDEELVPEPIAPSRVGETDEFSADFVVKGIPNGPVSFRCSAKDEEQDVQATDEIQTLVDHGPAITVIAPTRESAHQLQGAIRFDFTVEPSPLTPDDDNAEVKDVRLVVEGMDVSDLMEVEGEPGHFTTSIDFADPVRFPEPLIGTIAVEIYATNHRTPMPAEAEQLYNFLIDAEGPEITILEPADESVVGGTVILRFSVIDVLAGVDEDTVLVTLNGEAERFSPGGRWTRLNDVFTFSFDATELGASQAQASIKITAADLAGNEAIRGATSTLYLDNYPPIVDLDPGWVREYDDSLQACSRAFDPVGISPNDLDRIQATIPQLRALVWDQTNRASGATTLYYAGVNTGSVSIYLQPDPTQPIVKDTNNDGVCDEIADFDLEMVGVNPIPPNGRAWYDEPPADDIDRTRSPLRGDCPYDAGDSEPDRLCDAETSDLTRVIGRYVNDIGSADAAVIFGIGNLEGVTCTGGQWEVQQHIPEEGWVCLAARATDVVDNVGVSAPLRLCFDDPAREGEPPCASGASVPPSCVAAGCASPARFPWGSKDELLEYEAGILYVE